VNRKEIIARVDELARDPDPGGALQRICDYLRETVAYYNWVGFYLAYAEDRLLLLGPFSGKPTEHLKISYGRGICGQAADSHRSFVVQDVSAETNYLSCSIETKAEIVVPVWHHGKFAGELDIDSHELNPFTSADEELLGQVAAICAANVAAILAPTGE